VPNICTAELIEGLQGFALGSDSSAMSDCQVRAAVALLDRAPPDLHHVQLTIPTGGPISVVLANANASKKQTGTARHL